uniref:Germin-like protein n=1 Tax=Nicotiana sylvestris TaxID=4096 RepID=A0A1U7WT47_NICSY|nr:PREDICTED: putative germin-like protein 2-2 [Nicotiana sylvestris]
MSVAIRRNLKLAAKFYGPFEIIRRIGQVAYELQLPPELRLIKPVAERYTLLQNLEFWRCVCDPQGLIHFKYSMGSKNATFLTSLNSQNLGVIMIPNTIFASDPSILDDVLAKGFQLDKKMIKQLRKKFS